MNILKKSKCSHKVDWLLIIFGKALKSVPRSTKINLSLNLCRKVTLTQFITKWKYYVIWRRHRKEQYSIADKHFNDKITPK